MKKWYRIGFYSLLLGVFVWGMIIPNGIRGALANNAWSIAFVKQFYNPSAKSGQLLAVPSTHPHASLLLAKQALKSGNLEEAARYLFPLTGFSDSLVSDTYADILYLQKDYIGAFDVWKELNDTAALGHVSLTLESEGRRDLALIANRILFDMDQEKFTSKLVWTLYNLKYHDEAVAILNRSIEDYPDSELVSDWQQILVDVYGDDQD